MAKVPSSLFVVIERPDLYTITCNGKPVSVPKGVWWLDKAFGKIDIASAAHVGENVISLKASPFTIFHELELVALTGRVALGKDPIISTSYSVDGQSWSQDRPIRVGTTGSTRKRLAWFQQGHMRNWRIQRFRGDTQARLSLARLEAKIEGLAY